MEVREITEEIVDIKSFLDILVQYVGEITLSLQVMTATGPSPPAEATPTEEKTPHRSADQEQEKHKDKPKITYSKAAKSGGAGRRGKSKEGGGHERRPLEH